MSQWHNTTSTGYETPASMDMTATRENNALHYDISSGDGKSDQHSVSVKNFASDDAAVSSNERTEGTGSRPLQGSVPGVSRARSRSSRTTSKSESSAEEMHTAKHATGDQPPGSVGKTTRTASAGNTVINSCDPRMQRGVTGLVPLQKLNSSPGSDGKTLPTIPLAPMDIRTTVPNLQLARVAGSRTSISDTPPKNDEDRLLATNLSAEQHWRGVYVESEKNLVGALLHKAGQYKDSLQTAYTEEVGAVKQEAEAEVAAVHQQAEHFAATVVEGAEMYTSGVRADAQRKIESERQATNQAAEKEIQQISKKSSQKHNES